MKGSPLPESLCKKDREGKKSKKSSSPSGSGSKGSRKAAESAVVELTDDNFDEIVMNSNDVWLVEFFAPWCGHCKNLAPEWEKAASDLKGQVKVGAVDATVHQRLAQTYEIKGFPTIKAFPGGPKMQDPQDYSGGRDASSIVGYGLKLLEESGVAPTIEELTSQDLFDETCGNKRICVLAALPNLLDSMKAGREAYIQTLIDVTKKMRGQPFSFFWYEGGAQPKFESAFN